MCYIFTASVLKREIGEFENKLSRFESSLGPLVQKVLGLNVQEMFADLMGEPRNAEPVAASDTRPEEQPANGIELSAPDGIDEPSEEEEEKEEEDVDEEEGEDEDEAGGEGDAEEVEQNALEQSRNRIVAPWKDRLIRQHKRHFGALKSLLSRLDSMCS